MVHGPGRETVFLSTVLKVRSPKTIEDFGFDTFGHCAIRTPFIYIVPQCIYMYIQPLSIWGFMVS